MNLKESSSRTSPFHAKRPRGDDDDMENISISERAKLQLHESEIDIFQQLCLEKHDESSAIEILLSSNNASKNSKSRNLSSSLLNNASNRRDWRIRKVFSVIDNTATNGTSSQAMWTSSKNKRTISERLSSLNNKRNGTFTSTKNISDPVPLQQQQSISSRSLDEIRMTFKEMEAQWGKDSARKKKLSRQRIMRAMLSASGSVDDPKERISLQKELSILMEKERIPRQSKFQLEWNQETEGDVVSFSDPEETKPKTRRKENHPLRLLSSMGPTASDGQKAAQRALDDLLWTEFVSRRKETNTHTFGTPSDAADADWNWDDDDWIWDSTSASNSFPVYKEPHASSRLGQKKVIKIPPPHGDTRGRARDSNLDTSRSWWRRPPNSGRTKVGASFNGSACSDPENTTYTPTFQGRDQKDTLVGCHSADVLDVRPSFQMVDTASRFGYEVTNTLG